MGIMKGQDGYRIKNGGWVWEWSLRAPWRRRYLSCDCEWGTLDRGKCQCKVPESGKSSVGLGAAAEERAPRLRERQRSRSSRVAGRGLFSAPWETKRKNVDAGLQEGLQRAAAEARPPPPGSPQFSATSLVWLRILPCPEPVPSLGLGPAGWSPTSVPGGRGPGGQGGEKGEQRRREERAGPEKAQKAQPG